MRNKLAIILRLARKYGKKKAEGGGTKLGIPNPLGLTEITHQPMATAWRGSTSKPTIRVPIEDIEHGESAMPGGKLTWPGAWDLVRDYAKRPTKIPPIDAIPPDAEYPKWMVTDGSHRLEAAKLRGDTHIDVNYGPWMNTEAP